MITETSICPYTGLRPFTEDESIYFKGRDEHVDQATKQLQNNKFIMLTGASGDGKSSLVYAGIIPNARAGFLKSRFSNWAVASFRPERNPMENLCHALAGQLGIANETTVRTELSYGFSALVDMYKASSLYADVNDSDWHDMDETQRSRRKRQAANLVIVADQFEEFFTNPENFIKGIPSQNAALVTNLLLETARIALEENLPIYVIITMRSDFIGQCAAFSGLPEAIGFSQFFVPRLNRSQLKEVIEEPALLSGNRISRRLGERLIHDMVEGTDQLPILQHALNQIWKMADEGRIEMDLVHYAMVGGMQGKDLPVEESGRFNEWFEELPDKIQACYEQPDLQNVLNTHANKLYTFASDYLKERNLEEINETDSRVIIEMAFKCLTKVDNGRAVRNRMTLSEITAIINHPDFDFKTVAQVLNIFREPGNTLLRPFVEDVPELKEDSVLDITHESLIRNWEKLDQWAKEEFNNYTTFLDFTKQLNRWVDSGKSNSFLLYIGPLTYFENFFLEAKPNASWIARYLGEASGHHEQRGKGEEILSDAHEFLRRSASKHVVTRALMKYGAGKIAMALGILTLLVVGAIGLNTFLNRRNDAMLRTAKEQAAALINNPKILASNRALLATLEVKLKLATIRKLVDEVNDPLEKIRVANGIATSLVAQGRTEPAKEIAEAIAITDSLFENYQIPYSNSKRVSSWLKIAGDWRAVSGLAYFYNPSAHLLEIQQRNAKRSGECVLKILSEPPAGFDDLLSFTLALETAVNFKTLSSEQLAQVIAKLSTFENNQQSPWVKANFSSDQILHRGSQGYGFSFNGLYQDLALLYAATGNVPLTLQATDSLLKYNGSYYEGNYATMHDNATNVASVFYRAGHADLLDSFVLAYCQKKKIGEVEFYQRLLGRMMPYQITRNLHFSTFWIEEQNLNLQYGESKEVSFFFEKFRAAISKIKNDDERNFLLALSWKDEGLILAHRSEVVGRKHGADVDAAFEKSFQHYHIVSESYLNETIDRVMAGGTSTSSSRRKALFLFPDLNPIFSPQHPRDYHWSYLSVSFTQYIIKKNLFKALYSEADQLDLFEEWLASYHYHVFGGELFIRNHADPVALAKLESALGEVDGRSKIDLNLLYLYLGYYAKDQGDQQAALQWYLKIKPENLANVFRDRLLPVYIRAQSMLLIANAFTCLVQKNKNDDAKSIVGFFKNPVNRSSLYAFAAREFIDKKLEHKMIDQLMDSANAELNRIENSNTAQPNRALIAVSLVMDKPEEASLKTARAIIRNQPFKYQTLQRISRAFSYRGEIYKASQIEPENISIDDRLFFLYYILLGHEESLPQQPEWVEYHKNIGFMDKVDRIIFSNESN